MIAIQSDVFPKCCLVAKEIVVHLRVVALDEAPILHRIRLKNVSRDAAVGGGCIHDQPLRPAVGVGEVKPLDDDVTRADQIEAVHATNLGAADGLRRNENRLARRAGPGDGDGAAGRVNAVGKNDLVARLGTVDPVGQIRDGSDGINRGFDWTSAGDDQRNGEPETFPSLWPAA